MLKTYRLILFNYHKLLLELSTESTVRIWKTFSALQGGGTGGYGRRQQGPPPPHAGGRRTACCVRHTGRSLPARPTAEKCAAPVGMSICRDGVLPQDPGGSPLGDHGSDGRESARETGVRGVEGRRPRLRGAWTREAGKGPWPGPRTRTGHHSPATGTRPTRPLVPSPSPSASLPGRLSPLEGPVCSLACICPLPGSKPRAQGPSPGPALPPPPYELRAHGRSEWRDKGVGSMSTPLPPKQNGTDRLPGQRAHVYPGNPGFLPPPPTRPRSCPGCPMPGELCIRSEKVGRGGPHLRGLTLPQAAFSISVVGRGVQQACGFRDGEPVTLGLSHWVPS